MEFGYQREYIFEQETKIIISKQKMAQKTSTTQDFIPIQEIRDGVVILRSG